MTDKTETQAEKCWPWTHKWNKWEIVEVVRTAHTTGMKADATIQVRRCEKCGKYQRGDL